MVTKPITDNSSIQALYSMAKSGKISISQLEDWTKDEELHGFGKDGAVKIVADHVQHYGLPKYLILKRFEKQLELNDLPT